jgi:acyl-CoA hydrolase
MNYNDIYQSKVVTAEEALQQVKSGQEIVCGLLACEPVTLLSQLHTIKDRVEEVSVVHANMLGEYEFFMNPEMKKHFLLNCWFYSPGPRKAHPYETVSHVPGFYLTPWQWVRSGNVFRPPDNRGPSFPAPVSASSHGIPCT